MNAFIVLLVSTNNNLMLVFLSIYILILSCPFSTHPSLLRFRFYSIISYHFFNKNIDLKFKLLLSLIQKQSKILTLLFLAYSNDDKTKL